MPQQAYDYGDDGDGDGDDDDEDIHIADRYVNVHVIL